MIGRIRSKRSQNLCMEQTNAGIGVWLRTEEQSRGSGPYDVQFPTHRGQSTSASAEVQQLLFSIHFLNIQKRSESTREMIMLVVIGKKKLNPLRSI